MRVLKKGNCVRLRVGDGVRFYRVISEKHSGGMLSCYDLVRDVSVWCTVNYLNTRTLEFFEDEEKFKENYPELFV